MAEHVFGKQADPGIVVINDERYIVGPMTRSSLRAIDEHDEIADDDESLEGTEARAASLIRYCGLRLRAENGGPPAGEVLSAAWEHDEAGLEDLIGLAEFLSSELTDAVPPPRATRRSTISGTGTSTKRRKR